MNSAASFSTPPEEEGPCGDWTYHEWAEAFSTNDLARSLPPGHIAVCRVQTGGRGRFNRKWIGEEGGLWASFTVPLDTAAGVHWGHLPLVAGLALLNMLRSMGIANARLRWPNDVLIGKSKLAGILVERPSAHMAVIGMGINTTLGEDELPVPTATSLALEGSRASVTDVVAGSHIELTPAYLDAVAEAADGASAIVLGLSSGSIAGRTGCFSAPRNTSRPARTTRGGSDEGEEAGDAR